MKVESKENRRRKNKKRIITKLLAFVLLSDGPMALASIINKESIRPNNYLSYPGTDSPLEPPHASVTASEKCNYDEDKGAKTRECQGCCKR